MKSLMASGSFIGSMFGVSQRRDERAESEQEREDGGVDGVCGGGV